MLCIGTEYVARREGRGSNDERVLVMATLLYYDDSHTFEVTIVVADSSKMCGLSSSFVFVYSTLDPFPNLLMNIQNTRKVPIRIIYIGFFYS